MSLRWRFALALGALSAVAAISASLAGYLTTRNQLLGQIDDSVVAAAQRGAQRAALGLTPPPRPAEPPMAGALPGRDHGPEGDQEERGHEGQGDRDLPPESQLGNRLVIVQDLSRSGQSTPLYGIALPVDGEDRAIAAAGIPQLPRVRSGDINGVQIRIATAAIPGGGAVQAARRLGEAATTLADLRNRLILITLAVIAGAMLVGLLLARGTTAALERLTDTAETVAQTGSPEADVTVSGNDEVGRLGRAFAQMLASLNLSRAQQQQLVEDAGHELRTPLTSLRTNIAVLDRFEELPVADRNALIADLRSETGEMAALVDELVELSIGGDEEEPEPVRLDELAAHLGDRASRRAGREVTVRSEPATIDARPRALGRAINNLLDNAAKFDRSGGPIELTVTAGLIEVSDRGPGIPDDQLEAIFDRFHRTVESRNVPGSGLGLAIVRDVAERHGGAPYARNREGGGAVVGFTLEPTGRA